MPSAAFRSYFGEPGGAQATSSGVTNPATYNANFSTLYPNLTDTQGQVSGNTLSRLRGELSPETLNAIQDTAARFGIGSGMPLGGGGNSITGNFGRKLVGQTAEGLQSQGLQDYLNALKSYSGTLMATPGDVIGADTSRYGIDVGASTARHGIDTGARTASNALGENARQFDLGLDENQRQFDTGTSQKDRQFDTSSFLQNRQFNDRLGLDYAGLGQNYLNSYLQFLQ